MTGDVQPVVRTAADNALFWAAVKDAVVKEYEAARAEALAEMHRASSERQRVRDGQGENLGTVVVGEGKWFARVENLDLLVKWVADNAPEQLWTPAVTVRPSYVGLLLEQAVRTGRTGVPGIRVTWADGSLTVRANARAKEIVREILSEWTWRKEVGSGSALAVGGADDRGDGGAGGADPDSGSGGADRGDVDPDPVSYWQPYYGPRVVHAPDISRYEEPPF